MNTPVGHDRVAILCNDTSKASEIAKLAHRTFGTSLGVIMARVHACQPIVEVPMWENDHPERAAQLRSLIAESTRCGIPLTYFVLQAHDDIADADVRRMTETDAASVESALASFEAGIEASRRLDEEGHR